MQYYLISLSETNVWNLCIVCVICLTAFISIWIIAFYILKWQRHEFDHKSAIIIAGEREKEKTIEQQPKKNEKEIEDIRHKNRIEEIRRQAEEERNTFVAKCNQINEVIKEAASLEASGLNVSITFKNGGNSVTITTPGIKIVKGKDSNE